MDPLPGGRVTCCKRADWRRGARSPDPGNSGRNAFAENVPTHQAASRRASVHLHATFVRADLNQRKVLIKSQRDADAGLIDQEESR